MASDVHHKTDVDIGLNLKAYTFNTCKKPDVDVCVYLVYKLGLIDEF